MRMSADVETPAPSGSFLICMENLLLTGLAACTYQVVVLTTAFVSIAFTTLELEGEVNNRY